MSLPAEGTVPVVDVVEVPLTPGESIPESTGVVEELDAPDQAELLASGERDLENRSSISKADSGVDVGSSMAVDHASVDTQTDSHPCLASRHVVRDWRFYPGVIALRVD